MSGRRLVTLASLAGLTALVVAMVYRSGSYYEGIEWNLFLAWIPFVLALAVYDRYRRGTSSLLLWAGGFLWLVFFPNAPYIVTDFKWLRTSAGVPIWFDVVLLSAAASCGLLLGFMSLYLMQTVVRRAAGAVSAWLFVLAVLALSSFGVYLGRFLRWNSWDVFTRPDVLAAEVWPGLVNPFDYPKALAATGLFTAFLAATYLVFYTFAGEGARERIER